MPAGAPTLTRLPHIVIASADGDMAGLLSEHVAQLVLVQRQSPSRPAAWRLQTADSFQGEHSMPAHALSDFYALTGVFILILLQIGDPSPSARFMPLTCQEKLRPVVAYTVHRDLVPFATQASPTLESRVSASAPALRRSS